MTTCRDSKWLWLLGPAAVVLSSLESYLVLQLLSALVLFTVVFAILAALAVGFALLTVALDCAFQWTIAALSSIGRSIHASFRDVGRSPMSAVGPPQLSGRPRTTSIAVGSQRRSVSFDH